MLNRRYLPSIPSLLALEALLIDLQFAHRA